MRLVYDDGDKETAPLGSLRFEWLEDVTWWHDADDAVVAIAASAGGKKGALSPAAAAGGATSPLVAALKPQPPPSDGAVGLINMGNTCYLNAVLQCLSHAEQLTDYVL